MSAAYHFTRSNTNTQSCGDGTFGALSGMRNVGLLVGATALLQQGTTLNENLVSWDELHESIRKYDREVVTGIPELLEQAVPPLKILCTRAP